jgi:NAD(P)-dependent dehydrogenase (short-subunit alcohol dehydrogenase family)
VILANRTALITGAGKGIGRAVALAYAREGAAIVLVARTASDLENVAQEIRGAGGRALAVPADVSNEAQLANVVEQAKKTFQHVDVLVNNAGGNELGAIDKMDPERWWNQIEVHLKATYLLSRAFVPMMVERKWGRVINVSSRLGKIGRPLSTSYCSAKHAMIGFTRALALEVAESNVTVNAICPGVVDTPLMDGIFRQTSKAWGITPEAARTRIIEQQIPQKRLISVDELVPSFLFFASEDSARITGEAMNVSSGSVMH